MEQTKKPGYEEIYTFALEIICIEMIYRHSKYNFFYTTINFALNFYSKTRMTTHNLQEIRVCYKFDLNNL